MIERALCRMLFFEYQAEALGVADSDRAWCAGFFEGEGSVQLLRNGASRTFGNLTIEITQVDRSPLDWIVQRWGGVAHPVKVRNLRHRPFFRWALTASGAAVFLMDIRPFLVRQIVAKRVDLGIAFQAQKDRSPKFNRVPEYRARQEDFMIRMSALNKRGRAALEFRDE